MHTFGLPCRIDKIAEICKKWNIHLIEDAAEALGSKYKGISAGKFGLVSSFSFNGNKTITTGGGGAILTDNIDLAKYAKHTFFHVLNFAFCYFSTILYVETRKHIKCTKFSFCLAIFLLELSFHPWKESKKRFVLVCLSLSLNNFLTLSII